MSDLGAGWLIVALALLLALVLALIGMLWFVRGRRARSGRMPAPHGRPQRSSAGQARVDVPAGRDRYRIERQIGQGAMSTVHLAHDLFLDRPVALKTLSLSAAMDGEALDQARSRFAREAVTAGRLHHPGIVTVLDSGVQAGQAWMAMEYLAGHDLQRHTVPGQLLPLPQVLEIAARVAEALACAHRQGVVHRDIKPANVMHDAATGRVTVTDFGIASLDDAARTRTGLLLGTPDCMSPEQLSGAPVDGRSDLYALGVLLFRLLTGTAPHHDESMARLMHRIANEPAPDLRSLRPEVPGALADVVALALQKRPELRYSDGLEMAADLRSVAATLAPL